ncbi:MAG TPA: Na+/H+ antiporter subunit E [Povalibacter sp.]|nr:Na+/H+ antiporter subunit E [Povalibacter sp.]
MNDKGEHSTAKMPSRSITALSRSVMFLALWLVLMPSVKPADLAFGLVATMAATWTSIRLLPREAGHVRFTSLLAYVPHFIWQSVMAGVDVARRALDPRMPLQPRFVVCPVSFPPGLARNEFASILSLMPGSVPVGESQDAIIVHCLDAAHPLMQQVAEEERLLASSLVAGESHG